MCKLHILEREMQPTPVFSPGNSQDREALWATVHGVAQESDMTEQLNNNKAAHI